MAEGDTAREGPPRIRWRDDEEFAIGDVTYGCRPRSDPFPSKPNRFCVRKPREVIERYEGLLAELRPRTVIEVGVYEAGSAAMVAQLTEPERMVTIELDSRPNRAFERFIDDRGARDRIHPHWGVDQGDARKLRRIVADEFGDRPLDLVIDDASHRLAESRRTFEALFPQLRPGGAYVLEDWAWAHALLELWPEQTPLTVLVAELTVLCARHPDIVGSLSIERPWAVIRRGEQAIGDLSLAERCGERGRRMIEAMEAADPPGRRRVRLPGRGR